MIPRKKDAKGRCNFRMKDLLKNYNAYKRIETNFQKKLRQQEDQSIISNLHPYNMIKETCK